MSTSTICTSCVRALRQQTRRHLLQSQKTSRTLPSTTRTFTSRSAFLNEKPSTSTKQTETPPPSTPSQASFIASLASKPALRATTEPYVAYGGTEELFKACASTCNYTIPALNAKPPQEAPKNERGEDVGVGEGWWFAPRAQAGLDLPVTFNMWAQVMYLHMYALTARLRRFPAEHVRIWEQNLLDHFFYAAEDRMAMWHGMAARGVRNKYLKDLWVQWRGVLVSYDEGLIKGDAVLGAAVWRNVFQAREDVNLEDVAVVVAYLRNEITRLDKVTDSEIASGAIRFSNPAQEKNVVAELKSVSMDRPFSSDDRAAFAKTQKAVA
ncbi:hypothetical protein Q7P37_007801 [Cladosporium fusiforme]